MSDDMQTFNINPRTYQKRGSMGRAQVTMICTLVVNEIHASVAVVKLILLRVVINVTQRAVLCLSQSAIDD